MGMENPIREMKNESSGGFLTPSTMSSSEFWAYWEEIEKQNVLRKQKKIKEIAEKLKEKLSGIAGEIEGHEEILYIRENKNVYEPGRVIICDSEYIRVEIADTIDACNSEKSLIFTDEEIIYSWYDDGTKFISVEYPALRDLDLVKILSDAFINKTDLKAVFMEILNQILK
jgi:hypothetical protein